MSLLEAVPNFSEGRRQAVIDRLVRAASVPGVRVLDVESDTDHNRSVLTLAGESEALLEGLFRAIEEATETIDLRVHEGVHPRIGATDVVPFVPIGETRMDDAVAAANALGERVARELSVPVYFYEEAARRPEYRRLEQIRGKGFEQLREEIVRRPPDLGPAEVHRSAGAVVIGARQPLIAYNIYLGTEDVAVARSVARRVRASSGGLAYVKALGLPVEGHAGVQVSMNLTDFRRTAMHTVFNLVRDEAAAYGVPVTSSEIVGLVPLDAILDAARYYLRLHDLSARQILEMRLADSE